MQRIGDDDRHLSWIAGGLCLMPVDPSAKLLQPRKIRAVRRHEPPRIIPDLGPIGARFDDDDLNAEVVELVGQ
ncbi:MAG: hypothetical protein WBE50_17705, partial [Methyloceanibacter sp.]